MKSSPAIIANDITFLAQKKFPGYALRLPLAHPIRRQRHAKKEQVTMFLQTLMEHTRLLLMRVPFQFLAISDLLTRI
jgi:hypothetical protein